jgi:hypothetical protein
MFKLNKTLLRQLDTLIGGQVVDSTREFMLYARYTMAMQ